MYNLVDRGDNALREPCLPFDFTEPPIDPHELIEKMSEVLTREGGIGLSANQLGLSYRVFIIGMDPIMTCFNPYLVDVSEETITMEEGCLTERMIVKVKRPRRIKVRFADVNGDVQTRVFDGMTARLFLHEMDHMDGIDWTRRANRYHLEQAKKRKR